MQTTKISLYCSKRAELAECNSYPIIKDALCNFSFANSEKQRESRRFYIQRALFQSKLFSAQNSFEARLVNFQELMRSMKM